MASPSTATNKVDCCLLKTAPVSKTCLNCGSRDVISYIFMLTSDVFNKLYYQLQAEIVTAASVAFLLQLGDLLHRKSRDLSVRIPAQHKLTVVSKFKDYCLNKML